MNRSTYAFVLAVASTIGSVCIGAADGRGVVKFAGRTYRDVIGTSFSYPFQTDADMCIYHTDVRGRVSTGGGPVMFSYPGIKEVVLDKSPLPILRTGPNLIQVRMPAGTHDVEIIGSPEAASTVLPDGFGANVRSITSLEEFKQRVGDLKPDDEVVVKNGVYSGWWMVTISGRGTEDKPIVVRPETPGGVVFRRRTHIRIEGTHVIVKGFRFDHAGPYHVLYLADGEHNRVTQCQFFHCGNPLSTFNHIVRVTSKCHRSRVDHCYFTGSKSMSLGLHVQDRDDVGVYNRFDHNIWRDIYRFWGNGQENIQLGGPQRGPHGDIEPHCTVEYGLFDHAWGDSEIISNKSSNNIIRYNVAAHCLFSAFTLRGGHDVRFEGNVMVNNAGGVRVMGKRHVIVNNLFLDMIGDGVALEVGSKDKIARIAAQDALVANNTFLNCGAGIGSDRPTQANPFPVKSIDIRNNLLAGREGVLMDVAAAVESTVERNLFWATGRAKIGEKGGNAIIQDPKLVGAGVALQPAEDSPAVDNATPLEVVHLDRWQRERPHGKRPDIGADEVGAGKRPLDMLPEIPPPPLLLPEFYKKKFVCSIDPKANIGGARLPEDFVMEWGYLPQSWDAEASVTFCAGADRRGYTISWGGVDRDGVPTGVIALRKGGSDEIVADGADIVHYRMSFRKGNAFAMPTTERPDNGYFFTLIKDKGHVWLALKPATGFRDVPVIPVLVWEDRGDVPAGTGIKIEQKGPAIWQDMDVWEYGYVGPTTPPAPRKLTAEAPSAGRIALRWTHGDAGRATYTYEVYRGTAPDFTPSKTTCIASRVRGCGYDDFDVKIETIYYYRVRSRSVLGLTSGFAETQAVAGTDGPLYLYLKAESVRGINPPFVVRRDPDSGETFLWAPPNTGSPIDAPPDTPVAEYVFDIPRDGTYGIWAQVMAPNHSSDSFYVCLDPGPDHPYRGWSTGVQDAWEWRKVRHVTLTTGGHTFGIKPREAGARLKALLITNDLGYEPPMSWASAVRR